MKLKLKKSPELTKDQENVTEEILQLLSTNPTELVHTNKNPSF